MNDFDIENYETSLIDKVFEIIEEIESKMSDLVLDNEKTEEHRNMFQDILDEYGIETISDNPVDVIVPAEMPEVVTPAEFNGDYLYDAGDAMELWEYQGDTNRCAQYSQIFVIEEFTGLDIDPDIFCAFSEMNGWFDENGGTTFGNMNKMLDLYGINNEMSDGNSFEDLLDCLENDGRAIVALDSGEYWGTDSPWEDETNPYGADHAVEVIGYNPETQCVILNDSGHPEGCGEEVPLDTFLDAWEDSGNLMIECYR